MLRSARFACITLLALPALAFAQAEEGAVPAATCVQPKVPAIDAPLDNAGAEKLNADSKSYAACADAYVKARQASANKYQAISNAHINALNAFAADFNTYSTNLVAYSKARAAKTEKDTKKK